MNTTYLSKEAINKIEQWRIHQYDGSRYAERPSWDNYFLELAFDVRTRSDDAQTQCGAVIVSPTKEPLAGGYNGTMRDIEDGILPNIRPDKYDWMIHAEHNAILSCARQGKSTLGATVYVTGEPCLYCYQYMWQVGIKEIVYGGNDAQMCQDEDMKLKVEIFKALTAKKLTIRQLDFSPKH